MGWYTLVSSCPLYPLYGDTGLLAARKQERFEAGLSAPFPEESKAPGGWERDEAFQG